MRRLSFALLLVACGVGRPPAPAPLALPFATDTSRAQVVRRGVVHRFIYAPSGPWAIHVLDVDLGRCFSPIAVKGAAGAVGREKTSVLLRNLARTRDVVGGVNADFFLFTPPGVPTGALISNGMVITGPGPQPVFMVDARGHPGIAILGVEGDATSASSRLAITAWNRAAPRGLALFDAAWGATTDTATSTVEVVLGAGSPRRVITVDTLPTGVAIPPDGEVLVAGPNAPDSIRAALLVLRPADAMTARVAIPSHPREAVGGRPILARDSVIVQASDSLAQSAFATTRHPRTAVGIARGGKRLLLVTVDGRQANYSAGMTLPELARLMLALGARDALNLDGGGSTTLVYADPDSSGTLRIANRPSDAQGERPVGDAIAVVAGCSR